MPNERLIETFFDLVRIDSPSGSEAGVAAYCADRLRTLGFDVTFDDTMGQTGADTGNLIAVLEADQGPTLVLSAHMDCVEPCRGVEPLIEDGFIVSAGDTVLGADDKAGIAAILVSLERILAGGTAHGPIRVVLTVSEETGLKGAKALDPLDAAGDLCLVLDADGSPGGIVIGAPTHYTFAATFLGKSSHAGVAPEQGISAIEVAAQAITEMELGRLDEVTTANIGTINGGTATNVVPGSAVVTGECRSLDPQRVEDVRASMDESMRVAAQRAGGSVEPVWTREYASFSFDEGDESVRLVSDACKEVGIVPRTFTTGGGSDANIFAAAGVSTLVLSCGMDEIHGVSERLRIEDLESLTALLCVIIERMAE